MRRGMSAMMMMVMMMMLMNMPGAQGGHIYPDDGDGDEDVKVIVKMYEMQLNAHSKLHQVGANVMHIIEHKLCITLQKI